MAETGFEVGKLAERVEFSREELVEVGLGVFGDVDDDGIRREIAEALGAAAQDHGHAADEVAAGQEVGEAQEIAQEDLVELQPQALRVHDPQAHDPFAHGLPAPVRKPDYAAIGVEIETKSSWRDLIAFLSELQTPEQFIVLDSANLKIDSADPTQMRGRFKIARWYAPK